MGRFRQQWKRNNKRTSGMTTTNTVPTLTVSTVTHVDTSFQSMLDGSVTSPPRQPRPLLSDSVRARTKRPKHVRSTKWKFHPLQFTARDIIEPEISWTYRDHPAGSRSWVGSGNLTQFHVAQGRSLPPWPSVPSMLDAAEFMAKNKAVNYLDRPKLSLGEPIGELRTLPRDLRPHLAAIERKARKYRAEVNAQGNAKVFVSIARRSSRRLKSAIAFTPAKDIARYAARRAAETWARYAFIIGPLIRTAEDVATEYASRIDTKDLWQTARGFGTIRTPPVFKSTNGSALGWSWTWEQVRWIEYEVQAGILFCAPDRQPSVPGRLGLVKRDWPVTAWELMPLSFMIDRVINVKRFLRTSMSLSSPNVSISRDSFLTTRVTDVQLYRMGTIRAPSIPQAFYNPATSPWCRIEDFTLIRSRWWPDLGDVLATSRGSGLFDSLSKMADLASLSVLHLTQP